MLLAVAAALAIFASLAGTAGAKPLSAEGRAFVDGAVAGVMQEDRLPGLMLKITGPAGSYSKAYGVADIATNRPLALNDEVRIASITKSFTATAVLQLVQHGTLSLNDRLADFFKGIPYGRKITLRQILAMRSGVWELTADPAFLKAFTANPLLPSWRPTRILKLLRTHKPQFRPGARTLYTDTNYILLGLIMEKATGMSARGLITRNVIKRLGLKHTYFPVKPGLRSPFSHGYYAGEDNMGELRDYTRVNPNVPWTGGGMVSTVGDLQKWGKALAAGTLLSKRLQRARLHFGEFPNSGGPFAGYGLGILKIGDWIGHDGAIFGFSTATFYEPKSGAQIVVATNLSTNSSTPSVDAFAAIAKHFYPSTLKPKQ